LPSQCLISDYAISLATVILDIVEPCLRDEEKVDALEMFTEACRAMLISYAEATKQKRLRPSDN
jgi:hypothetical protein